MFHSLKLFLFVCLNGKRGLTSALQLACSRLCCTARNGRLHFLHRGAHRQGRDTDRIVFPIAPRVRRVLGQCNGIPGLKQEMFPVVDRLVAPRRRV